MMTPKEKAKELQQKMKNCLYSDGIYDAKKCASIAVDEIIKLDCLTDEGWLNVPQEYKVQYWKEVKQELNEL